MSIQAKQSAEKLKSLAYGRWREILTRIGIPAESLTTRGAPCPKCGGDDRFAVFRDFDETGGVHCRKCFTSGADGIATVRWFLNCNFRGALKAIRDFGLAGDSSGSRRASSKSPAKKPPTNGKAAASPTSKPKKPKKLKSTEAGYASLIAVAASVEKQFGRAPDVIYPYATESTRPVGAVLRWDLGGGKKEIRPVRCENGEWFPGGMPEPRPLYRLPDIIHEDRVIVVEGEKCVDRLRDIKLSATTSAHGSKSFSKSDWSPLSGRDVLILPDNDEPGREYAFNVAKLLVSLDDPPKIRIVELPLKKEKDDVADLIRENQQEGADDSTIRSVILQFADKAMPLSRDVLDQFGTAEGLFDFLHGTGRYVEFPVDVLPPPVSTYVAAASKAIGCDAAYVALPMLSALAACVGNRRSIRIKNSWSEPCVIWTAVVGDSGSLKSPAFAAAMSFLEDRQEQLLIEHDADVKSYADERKIYDVEFRAWQKEGAGRGEPPPKEPEPPVAKRLLTSDATVEALALRLSENPLGLLSARDELSGFFSSFDAYKSARGADVPHYLSMHRAGSLTVDRKTGKQTMRIARAAVSITGTIQPPILQMAIAGRYDDAEAEGGGDSIKEHLANGLVARFLFAQPPRKPKRWTDDDVPEAVAQSLGEVIDRLLSLEPHADEQGRMSPVAIPFDDEAMARWREFYNEHAEEQHQIDGDLSAAWSKLEGYAARFSLLIHVIKAAGNGSCPDDAVGLDSLHAGIELARWFAEEAARIYRSFGAGSSDTAERRETNRLRRTIEQNGGEITVRELMRKCSRYGTAADAERVLRLAVKSGQLESAIRRSASGVGRPVEVFRLADDALSDSPPSDGSEEYLVDV